MATRGIDIRQTADRIIFRASLKDSAGNKVTTGTTELRVYRLQDDRTLHALDWDAGVKDFVVSSIADDEVTMEHQQASGSIDTGIWTYALTDATILANFDSGQVYIAQVTNSSAAPESQEREFQFGGVEGTQSSSINVTDAKDQVITEITLNRLTNAANHFIANGVIGPTGNDTTHLHLQGQTHGTDEFKNCVLRFYDASTLNYHMRNIIAWNATTDIATLDTAIPTPQAGVDEYAIMPQRQIQESVRGGINTGGGYNAITTLDGLLAGGDIDGFTVEETLKLCLAALTGKLSGAATAEITIRAADDSKSRIVAAVDTDGNRTDITTLDASG